MCWQNTLKNCAWLTNPTLSAIWTRVISEFGLGRAANMFSPGSLLDAKGHPPASSDGTRGRSVIFSQSAIGRGYIESVQWTMKMGFAHTADQLRHPSIRDAPSRPSRS